MLISMIGLVTIVLVAIVIGALKVEKHLWTSKWRFIFPGYQEAAAMKAITDRLKDNSDIQYDALLKLKLTRDKEYAELYHRVYDVDGLEAQVADLKQVLEWTRNSLNDAKQEVLAQMGYAHEARERLKVSEDVRRNLYAELRKRATLIRELKGIPARKRTPHGKRAHK